jgi:hypothetical protein
MYSSGLVRARVKDYGMAMRHRKDTRGGDNTGKFCPKTLRLYGEQ